MGFPWVIVGGTGYDVEEVDNPRTIDMVCPSCDKPVRFVEKELVKNIRVFGLPLLGIERGRRVFECPRCKACVESPTGSSEDSKQSLADAIKAAESRLDRARFEAELWRRRVELARTMHDHALAEEAERLHEAANRDLERAMAEIERLTTESSKRRRREELPVIVARQGDERIERDIASEFAALKARLQRRAIEESEASAKPSPPEAREAAPSTEGSASEGFSDAAIEDEFASLKARLRRKSSEASGPEPVVTSTPSNAAELPHGEGTSMESQGTREVDEKYNKPASDAAIEDEFAALKARLAARGTALAPDAQAYEDLKREVASASSGPAPCNAGPTSATGAAPEQPTVDDDPVATLKRKLRRPSG